MINHELLESLEYKGPYEARYECHQCTQCPRGVSTGYFHCGKQSVEVHHKNNICRGFYPRIKNPSAPEFNFNNYLEFLGSEYYRPYGIDETLKQGSAKLGEVVMDQGLLADVFPDTYSPLYKFYDKPFCINKFPRCFVKIENHKFEIDYKRYRELKTVENGKVQFVIHLWKDNPNQRKYQKEAYGLF